MDLRRVERHQRLATREDASNSPRVQSGQAMPTRSDGYIMETDRTQETYIH